LNCKIDLSQIVGCQLDTLELLVGCGTLIGVLGGETFGKTASTVLASTATLASLRLTFGS
jgi:hypothetical protein